AGRDTVDAGPPRADGGPVDAGVARDAGITHVDGGITPADAGITHADAGASHADAGTTPADAGIPPADAGVPAPAGGRARGDGRAFHVVATGTTFNAVWGSAPDDVWFGGSELWRWDGAALRMVTALPAPVRKLAGCARDRVYATTGSGVYAYDGRTWTQSS